MKQETGKKNNKWLLPVIIIAALLVIAGIIAAIFLLGGNGPEEPAGSGVQAEIYWNVDRKNHLDEETGLSIREAGEDGLYHIRFAYNGELVELTANDKKLVNRIDMMDHMGLEVDDSGSITNVIATADVCTVAAENFFVQKMEGGILQVNSSAALNGMEMPFNVSDKTGIYNVSPNAENLGGVDEVEPMDKVVVLQSTEGETTHVFIVERMVTSDVYWRLEQYYNSTKKMTTRVPDAAGIYTIGFAVNGQQVELKCKDVDIVTYIDSLNNNVQCTGLTFDEQGFINGTITPANAVRGALVSNQFDVTELTETGMSTTRMLPSSNQGSTWTGNFAEGCKFYDVTGVSGFVGIEVDSLKLNDRVYVLTNAMGEAQIIFITNRMVESDLYWMVTTRKYNTTTKQTTQQPDENGWYVFEFIKNGKIVKLRTKDIAIASQVHLQANNVPVGFKLDGDVITQVYHYVNVVGGWVVASGATVTSINGPIVTVMSYGTTTSLVLNADCKITNAFDYVEKGFGEYTELKIGDQVRSFRNAAGEIVAIYVVGRAVDGEVYWNVTRKISNNETTRTPLPEGHEYAGYYEILLTTGGKKPAKYYTKSKKIASNIDRQSPASVGLQVKGNIITMAVPSSCVVGGSTQANNCHAEYWINEGYEFYALYRATGNGTKVKYNRETKIYNVSAGAANYVGQPEKDVKLNDQIHVITDTSGTAKYIYIVGQTVEGEPYYTLGSTTDEKGNVTFKMLHKGKVVDLKARDADVAEEVKSFTIGMGLHVKNGVITRAFSVASLSTYGGTTAANFDIMKVSGNKLELKRTRPGASNQGAEATVELMSGIKFYDVSPYAETPGKVVKPKVGDRVVMYLNEEGKQAAIGYITYRHSREAGAYGKCDHCGKTVYWNHWEGTSFAANAGTEKGNDTVHYYLTHDRQLSKQVLAGNAAQSVMHAVLDLNGKTITSSQRALGAWYGATLYVMDSSKAQTGTVIGAGAETKTGDGAGVALTTRGGSIVVNGGTWKVAEGHYPITDGGIFNGFSHSDFKAGTITINGGKFYGTDVKGKGGVLASNAPNIVINGGEFFGGVAGDIGGTIACPKAKLTINGGIIHGGEANYGATISCPNLTINGGTIEAGKAKSNGDCMYVSSNFNVTINGGKVASVTTTGSWTGKAVITGKPEIGELVVAEGKLVDLTGLTGGSINVSASGVFTTQFANDNAAAAAAKFLTPALDFAQIRVQDKALAFIIERCLYGHDAQTHETMNAAGESCIFDGDLRQWKLWTSNTSLPTKTGNYILTKDVTTANQTSIAGQEVAIDLNGCDVTYKIPAACEKNFRVFYLNDSASSNGKTEGATPSILYITDNSTADPAQQGTVTAINPEYAPNPADVVEWTAAGEKKAAEAYTVAGVVAYAKETAEKLVVGDAEMFAKPKAEAKAAALAKEAALLKGAEGSDAYKAEYKAVYDKEYEIIYKAEYDAEYKAAKDAYYQTWYDDAYASKIPTVNANLAALTAEAETAVQATGSYQVGTDAYKAAVDAKLAELVKAAQEAMVKDHVDGEIATRKNTHETADSGMIVQVANGNFALLGGNLDASGVSTKKSGTAIYMNSVLSTMEPDSQQFVMLGGTVSGGTTTVDGGAIYLNAGNTMVMAGGTVNGGNITVDGKHGGAIFGKGAVDIAILGGTVNGGTLKASSNSGAIYVDNNNANVMIGGNAVVNPGKAASGDSMYIRFGNWVIGDNAVINGGLQHSVRTGANLTITGAPTIQKLEGGSEYSIKLNSHAENNQITFVDLQPGAKIAFSSTGTVSQAGDPAQIQQWIDAGYFINETGKGNFAVVNDALTIGEYERQCVYGHTEHTGENADCAEPIELWQKWTDMTKLPTADGNYFVEDGAVITTGTQTIINDAANLHNVKLDLRGGSIEHNSKTTRFMLFRGAEGSQYVITSTKGKGTIKTLQETVTATGNDGLFYPSGGTTRLINLNVDASATKQNSQNYSIAYMKAAGSLHIENCAVKAGHSQKGIAIYQNPHTTAYFRQLVIKDSTIEGGVWVQGSATRTYVEGTVKLLPNEYCTYGISGSATAAEINCRELTADSQLVVAGMLYSFTDEAAATAAANTIIKPAAGIELAVDSNKLKAQEIVEYCINGHKTETECQAAGCTEKILNWSKWTSTTSLPKESGNYYVPEGTGITLSSQCIINDTARVVDIKLDLRGNTVTVNGEGTRALMLKADPTSQYVVISSTAGKATIKTTATTQNTNANGFIYANSGKIMLKNIKVDTTSVTSGTTYSTIGHVMENGIFIAENCELLGGHSDSGRVLYQLPTGGAADTEKPINLILKNTTVSGGVFVNGSAVKTKLEGTVKLLTGTGTYGVMGGNAAAQFDCTGLAADSVLEAANCNYKFADAPTATAANGVIIKAATGSVLSVNDSVITATVQ